MLTINFWKTAGETAIRAAAAAALATITAGQISAFVVDWTQVLGVSLLAGVVSILSSLVIPEPPVRAERREAKLAKDGEV